MADHHIVMLVKNTFTNDARVEREAYALIEAGIKVSIVALHARGLPFSENRNNLQIYRTKRVMSAVRSIGDPKMGPAESKQLSKLAIYRSRLLWHTLSVLSRTSISFPLHWIQDKRIKRISLDLKPTAIYAHDLDTLTVASEVATTLAIPLIYDSHEMATGRSLNNSRSNARAWKLEHRLLQNVDLVITASAGYAEKFVSNYRINYPLVINNVPNVHTPDGEKNLKSYFNIDTDIFLLVYQGNIQPNRGIEQTLHALLELPQAHLVLIGYGSHLLAIRQLIEQLKLQDRVHILGTVKPVELIDWSSSADLGICTIVGSSESYRNSMPNKLFEYMMSGIPILASNYPGMGNFVTTHKVGLTCDPCNPSSIAGAVQKLMTNIELYRELSENSKIQSTIYNWQNLKHQYVEAISDLLDN